MSVRFEFQITGPSFVKRALSKVLVAFGNCLVDIGIVLHRRGVDLYIDNVSFDLVEIEDE